MVINGYLHKLKQENKKIFGNTTKRYFTLDLTKGVFSYRDK